MVIRYPWKQNMDPLVFVSSTRFTLRRTTRRTKCTRTFSYRFNGKRFIAVSMTFYYLIDGQLYAKSQTISPTTSESD